MSLAKKYVLLSKDLVKKNNLLIQDSYSKLGIIVDFDGTLSPLAATPALAFIPHETKKVLERMANMMDVNIVIISGRDVDDLRQKVNIDQLYMIQFFVALLDLIK